MNAQPESASNERPTGDPHGRLYRGSTVEELIPRIQADLGRDAIVLNRRTGLTGGVGGFFQRRFVEIEAEPGRPRIDLYDDGSLAAPTASGPLATAEPAAPGGQTPSEPVRTAAAEPAKTAASAEFAARLAAVAGEQAARREPAAPAEYAYRSAGSSAAAPASAEGGATVETESNAATPSPPPTAARSRARGEIERRLRECGMSDGFVRELIDGAHAHLLAFSPRTGLAAAVRGTLEQHIPTRPPLPAAGGALALVGPGGSGKTSCAAALLSAYRGTGSLSASCATIAAGAKASGLELLLSPHVLTPVPASAPRAAQALRRARREGMAIIDTPPLSPSDRAGIRELGTLLGTLQPERVVVTLPATLGAKACAQLLEALRPLRADAVAITHADETDQLGVAIEAACAFGLAPEYVLARGRGRLKRVDPRHLTSRLLP